jgi:hypothetical protein
MIWRKHLWLGFLAAAVAALLLVLPATKSQSKVKSATILSTASNNGEIAPCG